MSKFIDAIVTLIALSSLSVVIIIFINSDYTPPKTDLEYLHGNISCWTQTGPVTCHGYLPFNLAAACRLEKRGSNETGACHYLKPSDCQHRCRVMNFTTASFCTCCADGCNHPSKMVFNY